MAMGFGRFRARSRCLTEAQRADSRPSLLPRGGTRDAERRPANPTIKPVTPVARESRARTRLRERQLRAKTRTRRSFKLP